MALYNKNTINNGNTALSKGTPPIIVIGMHRSGTTLVSKILEQLGIFMGYQKEINNESIFFLKINRYILARFKRNWMCPISLYDKVNEHHKKIKKIIDYINKKISSRSLYMYLGPEMSNRYTTLYELDIPWGWKDPRNTFTLPIWKQIFPDAKIIHVYRHGIDVATSLLKREKNIQRPPWHFEIKNYFHNKLLGLEHRNIWQLLNALIDTESQHITLERAFELWKDYMKEAQRYTKIYTNHVLEIKYEDLLTTTEEEIKRIMGFCNLERESSIIREIEHQINKNRKYAYKDDPSLIEFEKRVAKQLQEFGY